jgi:hypothetical protein
MESPSRRVTIDARPAGPAGPLAVEVILGRPVLAHLLELASSLGAGPVIVHARADQHSRIRDSVTDLDCALQLATGPPPEGTTILRTDRIYDRSRLRRGIARGRHPESAVLWRLDSASGLAGAEDELIRRRNYQPLGRFWALGPARWLARLLAPTRARPNHLTIASALLVLSASACIAWLPLLAAFSAAAALALAAALVLDTADGHLARLQGTASAFGKWLDSNLDELGDMTLHAAIAWAAYLRTAHIGWLLLGILYAAGKYLFIVAGASWIPARSAELAPVPLHSRPPGSWPRRLAEVAAHADVRWHLWIVLAACGHLELELLVYAFYYPARTIAGAARKAVTHA